MVANRRDLRRLLLANLALLITQIFWGSQVPIMSVLLATWGAFELSVFRFAIALPLFLAVLAWERKKAPDAPYVSLGRVALLGILGTAGFNLIYTLAVRFAGSIGAVVVASMLPLVAAIVMWVWKRQRLGSGVALALACATGGGLLAASFDGGQTGDGPAFRRLGEVLMLVALTVWTWYSHAAQTWLAGWSQMHVTAATVTPAALFLIAAYAVAALAGQVPFPPALPSERDGWLLIFLGIGPVFLGIMGWNYGVRGVGVVVASLYLNLMPAIAVATAALFGEQASWQQLLGGAIVLIGVVQVQVRHLRARGA
ncbi:MAG: DMT family transporter [Alphaproteobacteria bacterium]|nr:DMT family transporter [Alphaproteobacteria bacterium]